MFRYRLYPGKTQTKVLEEQLELCRLAYNSLLDYCKQQYDEKGKKSSQYDLNNHLITLKRLRPEFSRIHSQVLQNISKRIKDGYTNFYSRRRAGLKAGLPRFKKYGRYKSFSYPQSGFKVEEGRLHLSKIGDIKIRLHREIQGHIKTLTVKRMPSGKWFVCFSCTVKMLPREKPFEDIGIDMGLSSYAVLSDGTRFENPRFYRESEKRLAHLQRGLSRKERGGRNWVKANIKVARLYERILNRRNDFLHKASRKIADTYETVYVEDLKIRNMVRNRRLAKSISDAGWGRFIGMIAYKAESAGGRVIQVNPRNTSVNCSYCREQVKKSLSDRIHECPHCGLKMDRDHNAALNILARGREIGKELAESRPEGEETSTPPLEVVQVSPMKQEAFLLVGK